MTIIHIPDHVPKPHVMLCWKPQPLDQGMARCDRADGHGGMHTWEYTAKIDSLEKIIMAAGGSR